MLVKLWSLWSFILQVSFCFGSNCSYRSWQFNQISYQQEIHGLGAGGNKPVDVQHNDGNINPNHVSAGGHGTDHQGAHMQDGSSRGRGRGHGHGHGRGRSGDGGGGRGYGRKGQKKASIGNHNRKDKALRKMA